MPDHDKIRQYEHLIADLTTATGPDHTLDCEIVSHLGWTVDRKTSHTAGWRTPEGEYHALPPKFTGSIDDALTIEPQPLGRAEFGGHGGDCWAYAHGLDDTTAEAEACANVPIAFCVALLRLKVARLVEMQQEMPF